MPVIILTNNVFCRIGISSILIDIAPQLNRCYLDISSFKSVREIKEIITTYLDSRFEIILITDKNVCSRLFSPLHSFNLSYPLDGFKSMFAYDFDFFDDYLNSLLQLKHLTSRQKYIAKVLIEVRTIRKAALLLKIKEKVMYNHTRNLAEIMNFRSGCDLVNNIHVLI